VKLVDALRDLASLEAPVFTTAAAAARLRMSNAHASVSLARLRAAGQLVRLRRGVWAFPDRVDALALPEFLTAPFPAYVSLQSALYLHGMVSQVPALTYAVTLARSRRLVTPLGTVSLHHVRPSFFFGYEERGRGGGRLATPEKALVDFLYLAPTRSRLFRALPELEWPKAFRAGVAREVASRIEPASRRRAVARKLEELLAGRRDGRRAHPVGSTRS
jgi:predicted transcriptional regulator of viral defense system